MKLRYIPDCGRAGKRVVHYILLFELNNPKVRETRNIQPVCSGLYPLYLQTTARNVVMQFS
jgi:hypothetical protein